MRVVELIVDGFKSYATRTVISGWDTAFNAITGLNGTGKSNILDSICFVLGISNLSQVRVSNLQELIYKQGQAGVTKASVTIVFDNTDKSQSPVGYEEYDQLTITRQIQVGGKSKYLINGRASQNNRVTNLFHSVGLNVNNPHFLIMQGRITKVLNMKPAEMLAMIEEAAGTRMYEVKKAGALKTIEKKNVKLDEIRKILAEEITPNLEKLRHDRAQFQKWSQVNTEIAQLTRFVAAYDYVSKEAARDKATEQLNEAKKRINELSAQIKEATNEIGRLDAQISELRKKKDSRIESELKEREALVAEHSKALVKHTSVYQHKKEALEEERHAAKKNERQLVDLEKSLTESETAKRQHLETLKRKEAEVESLSERLNTLQNQLNAVKAGIAAGGDGDKSLTEQLMETKALFDKTSSESKASELRIAHLTKELKEKRKRTETADKEYEALNAELKQTQSKIQELEHAIARLGFDEKRDEALQKEYEQEDREIAAMKDSIQGLSRFQFNYSDPDTRFDRSNVKGFVANLVKVKNADSTTAIEVTAGGRLWNVVVTTAETGKQLLQKGKLQKRVTIIPLDKTSSRIVPQDRVRLADRLTKGASRLALELVTYDNDLEKAMEFVFGNTMICKDLDAAETVAKHPELKIRAVTLDGDILDPAGALTGGYRSSNESVLAQLSELNAKRDVMKTRQQHLSSISKQLEGMKKAKEEHHKLKHQIELKKHEAELLQARIEQSKHHRNVEECRALEKQLEDEKGAREQFLKTMKDAEERSQQIAHDIKNFDTYRDRQQTEIENNIASTKKRQQQSKTELRKLEAEVEKVTLQFGELEAEIDNARKRHKEGIAQISKLEQEYTAQETLVTQKKEEFEAELNELNSRKAKLAAYNEEISALMEEHEKLESNRTESDLELKKANHTIGRLQKQHKDAALYVENLMKKHPWIETEKQFFGKPHTDFDWNARSPQEAQERLASLQKEQDKLSKSINKKVMTLFEKAEQEYQDLIAKQRIVEKDKKKIEDVICELDEKKKQALEKTWQKVNRDFGSIFSTLLPGTVARLDPCEGDAGLEGLEVKVAFGGVWKESLTELSGGQRSLLALSLILALLLFKPAPMYILDEVDAALDLSHTQNIGRMLKAHFKNSQFIVVSLKEGMFNNANVIFRTKFVNGQSSVARTTNQSNRDADEPIAASSQANEDEDNNELPLSRQPDNLSTPGRGHKAVTKKKVPPSPTSYSSSEEAVQPRRKRARK